MSEHEKKMEVFRNEIKRRREEMKKTLCSQIDASFETSLDGLLNHVTKFINSVKPIETTLYKPTSPDQLGLKKKSAELGNQSLPRKKVSRPYVPSAVHSNVGYDSPVEQDFPSRDDRHMHGLMAHHMPPQTTHQMANQMSSQSVQRMTPRVDPRYDPRQGARYDPRLDPRYDPRLDSRYDFPNNQFQDPYRQNYPPVPSQNPYNDPRLDPSCAPRMALRPDPRSYRDNMPLNYGPGPTNMSSFSQVSTQYRGGNRDQQPMFSPPSHNP